MKWTSGSLLSILILLGIVTYPVAAQYSPMDQEGLVDPSKSHQNYGERRGYEPPEKIDWDTALEKMGSAAMSKAHLEIQKGSNVEKAKYAFRIYCDFLRAAKIPVNDRVETRVAAGWTDEWTCGDHLEKMQHLFKGAGIHSTFEVDCEKDSILTDRNHIAIGVPDDDKHPAEIYIFDPWILATRNEGRYDLENDPKWNGMPYSEWEREVRKNGYIRFDIYYNDRLLPNLAEAIRSGAAPYTIIPETATSTVPVSEPETNVETKTRTGTAAETNTGIDGCDCSKPGYGMCLSICENAGYDNSGNAR